VIREKKINFYDYLDDPSQRHAHENDITDDSDVKTYFAVETADTDKLLSVSGPPVPCTEYAPYLGPCVDTGVEVYVTVAHQYEAYVRSSAVRAPELPAANSNIHKIFMFGTQGFESCDIWYHRARR
jgi:hypothetical protein